MEAPRVFNDADSIWKACNESTTRINDQAEDILSDGKLHVCNNRDESGMFPYHEGTVATPADIAQADIICFGGALDNNKKVGMLPAKVLDVLQDKGHPLDSNVKILSYDSKYRRSERIRDAYNWNLKKDFVSEEMQKLGEQVWKHRFLDNNSKLIPAGQFKGFAFLTQSFGARMSFMLENFLRNKLDAALREQKSTDRVSDYFNRIRRVSMSSAADMDGVAEVYTPAIPTLHFISQNDRGVAYREDFCDKCITSDICGHEKYVRKNAAEKELFGDDGCGHEIIIFNREYDEFPRDRDLGHGFKRYMGLMQYLGDDDVQRIHDDLSIGMRGKQVAQFQSGQSPG